MPTLPADSPSPSTPLRGWLPFERRWAQVVLAAFAVPSVVGLVPASSEVDGLDTLDRMTRVSTTRAALGLRLGVWLVMFAPIYAWGSLRLFTRLSSDERYRILCALLMHRTAIVRGLVAFLKLASCFAMLGTASVRARSGYDSIEAQHEESGPLAESGEHVRVRLPIANERVA